MARLYRSVLCASVTCTSQELLAASVWYFSPTANAIPTPTPHIQILDFDLYLKKPVFDPPTCRLCCWLKTLSLSKAPRGVSNGDSRVASRGHLAQKRFGKNNRDISNYVASLAFLWAMYICPWLTSSRLQLTTTSLPVCIVEPDQTNQITIGIKSSEGGKLKVCQAYIGLWIIILLMKQNIIKLLRLHVFIIVCGHNDLVVNGARLPCFLYSFELPG